MQNKLAKMERDGVLEKSFSLPPTSSPECGLSSQRLMHLRRGRLKILEHDICICYTVTLSCVAEIGFSKGYWDFSASAAGYLWLPNALKHGGARVGSLGLGTKASRSWAY